MIFQKFKRYLPLLVLLFLLIATNSLEAAVSKGNDTLIDGKEFIIHSYGGGALLSRVFNAISILFYGQSGWNGIFMIAMVIGGFSACVLALVKGSWEVVLGGWFFPALFICGILLVPRDTLYIKDHLIGKTGSERFQTVYKVDNVPYIMKLISSVASQIGYRLSIGLEKVTHGVNDTNYNWTGHIYAGDTLFQAGQVDINNPYLKKNLHNYVYDCVFNDINMEDPWYTKEDLYKAENLIKFMEEESGVWLSTKYTDNEGRTKPMRCKAAIGNIKKEFDHMELAFQKPTKRFQESMRTQVFGDLNSEAQQLIDLSQQSLSGQKQLLQQAFVMDSVQNTLDPQKYATLKAEQMHKQSQGILGAMGAKSIVAMKNFFEAAIYMVFPIILILAVVSLGFKTLITWLQFLLWINIWPPFFVVVNFLLNTTWDFRMDNLFGTSQVDLSVFTSHGLADLYSSMESIAAGALFTVPFLAYAFVKGGVGSMIHLAGTLNAPAQSAATQAASEQVSGNYSVGNMAYGNQNVSSTSMFQQNAIPHLQQGGMSYTSGNNSLKLDSDGNVVMNRAMTNVGADINASEVYGQGVQKQFSESKQRLESDQGNFQSSWSVAGNTGRNYMDSLASDHSFSHLQSKSEQDAATELYNTTEQQISDFNENWGTGKASTIEAAARLNAGLDIKGFGVGGNVNWGASTKNDTSEQVGARDSELKAIHDNLQNLRQYTQQDSNSENLTNAQRASIDHGEVLSNADSYTKQYQQAQSNHESWSKMHDDYQKSDVSSKQSLNNEFGQYLLKEHDNMHGVNRVYNDPKRFSEDIKGFTEEKQKEILGEHFQEVQERIDGLKAGSEAVSPQVAKAISSENSSASQVRGKVKQSIADRPDFDTKRDRLESEYETEKAIADKNHDNRLQTKPLIDQKRGNMKKTKVSEERKETVKKQAQENVAKTVGKKFGKKAGKFFYDGKKPIGFNDDD